MKQSGSIQNLQTVEVPYFGHSRCVLSSLRFFEKEETSSPLSLKLVTQGTERYTVHGSTLGVHKGAFLLVNRGEKLETHVKSKDFTTGLCIYPPQDLIEEVFSNNLRPMEKQLDAPEHKKADAHFTTRVLQLNSPGSLSTYLSQMLNRIPYAPKHSQWWLDFYLELAECLIADQHTVETHLRQLPSVKRQTREELFRRISRAREFIHDHRFSNISIHALSEVSALSKYHLLRTFKAAFGESPYQYILKLKLQEAMRLLDAGYSLKDISDKVGYSDEKNLKKTLRKSTGLQTET